jgi:hypothetical protein
MATERELLEIVEKCRMRKPRALAQQRDELIRQLYLDGTRVVRLVELTGLTNIRVYQILQGVIGQSKAQTQAA